ncbi:MAG TPA: hypothetical protein VF253_11795, partial [Candidatus Limnocylindrales bacterium]
AISGRTADLAVYENIVSIAADAAAILLWAEGLEEVDDNVVVMGHFNWQTDRSDPGQWFINLVMSEYAALAAPAPLPIPVGNTA